MSGLKAAQRDPVRFGAGRVSSWKPQNPNTYTGKVAAWRCSPAISYSGRLVICGLASS